MRPLHGRISFSIAATQMHNPAFRAMSGFRTKDRGRGGVRPGLRLKLSGFRTKVLGRSCYDDQSVSDPEAAVQFEPEPLWSECVSGRTPVTVSGSPRPL